jgi:hypothetical protein
MKITKILLLISLLLFFQAFLCIATDLNDEKVIDTQELNINLRENT